MEYSRRGSMGYAVAFAVGFVCAVWTGAPNVAQEMRARRLAVEQARAELECSETSTGTDRSQGLAADLPADYPPVPL